MADNVQEIASKLGAVVFGRVAATGGAFGAAKVAHDVAELRAQTRPVRIATATLEKLERLAERANANGQKVDALDVAARLLEEAVTSCEG
jgi:hypothetical protein